MEGRRNQGVLHKYLSDAARGVMVKGASLDERLYVPEPFRVELKDEIGERRRKKLALLLSHEGSVQYKMAISVGEYNGSEPTAFGRRIVVKLVGDNYLGRSTTTILAGSRPTPGRSWRRV